jgi:ribonucleotide reductase beta subunit family protein with ferritin-like domain
VGFLDTAKKHVASFWTPEEINFLDDMKHSPNLPPDQLHFISVVLSFLAISNKIVADNLSQNIMAEVTSLEVQFFYGFQLMMENIHMKPIPSSSTCISKTQRNKMKYTMQLKQCPSFAKAKWAEMWCNSQHASFAKHLITFDKKIHTAWVCQKWSGQTYIYTCYGCAVAK